MNRTDLRPYQERMVEHIRDTRKGALWAGMGLGKTVSALTAISDLFDELEISRVLIIAPLKVMLRVWPQEIEYWDHTKWMSYTILNGDPNSRRYKVEMETQIHIINREMVTWLFETLKGMKKFPYDMVIVDESSSFKNFSAKRTKALMKMSFHADYFIELTATPASNTLLDLWTQIFMLDKGERLGRILGHYRELYFEPDYMGYSNTLKEGAAEVIYNKLADICLTLKSEDYLKLPPRMEHNIYVELSGPLRKKYEVLENEFVIELEKEEFAAINSGALVNKLLQFCNGAVYIGEKLYSNIHDLKLDALEEIIEQCGDEPLLVAYQFRSDMERIKQRFPQAIVLDRKGTQVEEWNNGNIPLLLAHPASAGHGINLQHGGCNICWFGLNWSLELVDQFNGRLHRSGQTKPVQIYNILVRDSVDNTVQQSLSEKNFRQEDLLNHLKENIKKRG